jgi:hypothetical protein
MGTHPHMSIASEDLKVCPARITLDAAQLAFFNELPADAPSVQSALRCELEQGHEGSHAALGHQDGTMSWWVQWTLSASEINPYTWCSVASTPLSADRGDRGDQDCALFDGHPGMCSPGRQTSHIKV